MYTFDISIYSVEHRVLSAIQVLTETGVTPDLNQISNCLDNGKSPPLTATCLPLAYKALMAKGFLEWTSADPFGLPGVDTSLAWNISAKGLSALQECEERVSALKTPPTNKSILTDFKGSTLLTDPAVSRYTRPGADVAYSLPSKFKYLPTRTKG